MIEPEEVTEIFRNGTVEQCDALLNRLPNLVSHQFSLPSDRFMSMLEIAVATHDLDKLMLLVNRKVPSAGGKRSFNTLLASFDQLSPSVQRQYISGVGQIGAGFLWH